MKSTVRYRSLTIIFMLTLLAPGISCKKFLAGYSQNNVFLETAADLDELLVGDGYMHANPSNWMHLLDDDAQEDPSPVLTGVAPVFSYSGVHHWQQFPYVNDMGTEVVSYDMEGLYRKIQAVNTIIYNVPLLREKKEPENVLTRISGEAHFLRATYYFLLVNNLGKPYSTATASSDYGVPLKTDPAVEEKFFSRATVQEVYKQIIDDLLQAEKELEGSNLSSAIRASQGAAQGLLSRVYLYMEDYEKAITYADKVMDKRYRITDLNNHTAGSAFLTTTSPELIFGMAIDDGYASLFNIMRPANGLNTVDNYAASPDLINSYSGKDLRLPIFFVVTPDGEYLPRKSGEFPKLMDEYLVRLSEVYLNKAEALAVLGRNDEAITTLQELRKKRFRPADLTSISLTGEALVNFIHDERRRECCFELQRWFDLRRYGVNTRCRFVKSIRHVSYAYNGSGRYIKGYYELKPYEQDKVAYLLPISKQEIEFNQGALTNEPRVARPIHQ